VALCLRGPKQADARGYREKELRGARQGEGRLVRSSNLSALQCAAELETGWSLMLQWNEVTWWE